MIDYQWISGDNGGYVAGLVDGGRMESERDALDLVAACGEYGSTRLLLLAENLGEDFYNLRTGLAGAALLKFSNYRLKVAAVVPEERMQGRFGEMAQEANRRNHEFHVFVAPAAAEAWLLAE